METVPGRINVIAIRVIQDLNVRIGHVSGMIIGIPRFAMASTVSALHLILVPVKMDTAGPIALLLAARKVSSPVPRLPVAPIVTVMALNRLKIAGTGILMFIRGHLSYVTGSITTATERQMKAAL